MMANNDSMSFNIDGSDDKTFQHSRTLVSIDYVRVNKIDGLEFVLVNKIDDDDEIPGTLYGTVMVTDCWDDHIVYHWPLVHWQTPCEYITLTGPTRPVSGHDTFIVSVNLWVNLRVDDTDFSKVITKEICKGEIVWDPYTQDQSSYDKPLQQDLLGKHGSVSMGYSVIREALSATIKLVWINESPVEMFGTIKAYRDLGGSSTTRILLDKAVNRRETVNPQQSIRPTHPFIFPVSVHSCLTIEAELWDYNWSSDDQIVLGNVQFTPIFGTQTKNITGKYGQVQVSVTCE